MFHNRYIWNKVNRIVVNNCIDAILTSITVKGFFQTIFRYIQIFSHFIAVLAVMLKSTDNALKSNETVISPQAGIQLLLAIACILQIGDVSDGSEVVAHLFSKNRCFL